MFFQTQRFLTKVSTFQTASSWLYLFCYFKLCICSQNFPHKLRFNVKGAFVFVLSNSAFWNLQVAIQCKFHRNLRRHGILRSNITTTTARNILSLSHRRKWTTQKRFTLRWSTIFQSFLFILIICLDDQPVWNPLQLASVKSQGLVSPICPWQCEKIYLSCSFL